jgi:peptidyl-prolyl cis-trans isomerase SurA
MKRLVIIAFTVLVSVNLSAQKKGKDTTLFTYGSKKVSLKEFERGFSKNEKPGAKHTAKEVDEYLELYKKFKLKVQDAYDMGLDTTEGFKNELATYRKQIAKPYLTDRMVNDQLVNEAYDRLKYEVRASHILIFLNPDASAADSVDALVKINGIRDQIVSGKLTFENAAETFSEDPSAKDNKGDLGNFTAFQMIYSFENQAFNTPVGQVSKPFRTEFGYHIIKVFDKKESQGEMTVKHILLQTNPEPSAEEVSEIKLKVDEVYKKLKAGEKFETLVNQYSEDAQTSMTGGEIPAFSMTNQRLPEIFKVAAFALKNDGDYSDPIQTQAGFHIIKRINLKPIAPLKDMRSTILNKISRDGRQYRNTLAVYNKAQKFYKVKDNTKDLAKYITQIDSSLLRGEYQFRPKNMAQKDFNKLSKKPLFTLSNRGKYFTVSDFGKYLTTFDKPFESKALGSVINKQYEAFKMSTIMDYYENDLENTNDTFAALFKEYKEGILLFTLTDKKVWTKSVEDTTGLKSFYQKNMENYKYKDRYDATIFRCANKAIADAVKKDLDAGLIIDSITKRANKNNPLNLASPITNKFEKGDNMYADMLFETGKTDTKYLIFEDMKTPGGFVVIQIHKFILAGNKSLNEARGPITSDYQNFLEKEWLDGLAIKYPIIVNTAFYNIFKNRMVK